MFKTKLTFENFLFEIIDVTNHLKGVDEEIIKEIKNGQSIIVDNRIKDPDVREKLLEGIDLKRTIFHDMWDEVEDRGIEKGIEKGRKIGIEEGKEIGIKENNAEIAKVLLDDGFSIEYISKITKLSKDKILEL